MRPRRSLPVARAAVAAAAALFVAASLATGALAFWRDLRGVYAGPRPETFPPGIAQQIRSVRDRALPGAGILLVAPESEAWTARLWQRALYPRNPVVVRYAPLPQPDELAALAREGRAGLVVGLGDPPPGVALAWREPLPGPPNARPAWVGTLAR